MMTDCLVCFIFISIIIKGNSKVLSIIGPFWIYRFRMKCTILLKSVLLFCLFFFCFCFFSTLSAAGAIVLFTAVINDFLHLTEPGICGMPPIPV